MSTTKAEIKAGLTLVGKYKGEEHTCEVVEHDERRYFVRPDGQFFTSPSSVGKVVTGTATNGYRFWSVPEKAPSGQPGRQKAARLAVAAVTADAAPRTASGAGSANVAPKLATLIERAKSQKAKPAKLIERAKSQKDVPEGRVRYFCSS